MKFSLLIKTESPFAAPRALIDAQKPKVHPPLGLPTCRLPPGDSRRIDAAK